VDARGGGGNRENGLINSSEIIISRGMQAPASASREFPQLSATFRNRLSPYCSSSVHPGGGEGRSCVSLFFSRPISFPSSLPLSLSVSLLARGLFGICFVPNDQSFRGPIMKSTRRTGGTMVFLLFREFSAASLSSGRNARFARLRIIGERKASWDSWEPNALKRSPNRAVLSTLR